MKMADFQITPRSHQPSQGHHAPKNSRITGYHNAMNECISTPHSLESNRLLEPPTYDKTHQSSKTSNVESLPPYDCTVSIEGPLSLQVERTSPFNVVNFAPWQDTYAVLRGTMLSIHRLKTSSLVGRKLGSRKPSSYPGALLTQYTLQHAEIGVATDAPKFNMIPCSRMAKILPEYALMYLRDTDPQMFNHVRQYVIRLRVEGDQLLFRFDTPEERALWIDRLCTAVDIAPCLDERSEPRNFTLPRRRRRRQPVINRTTRLDLENSDIDHNQTRHMDRSRDTEGRAVTVDSTIDAVSDVRSELRNHLVDPETEEPNVHDTIPTYATASLDYFQQQTEIPVIPESAYDDQLGSFESSDSSQNTPDGLDSFLEYFKPEPTEPDPEQELRYHRKCMPSLLYNSRRASNMLIYEGQRMLIDWEQRRLIHIQTSPPSYGQTLSYVGGDALIFREHPLLPKSAVSKRQQNEA